MPDDHDDLRAATADLEDALAGLRAELDREPEGPDGEPSPEETLRVVEEVAIPTIEGLVAANLQTLEATREAVRAAREATGDGDERTASERDGTADAGAAGDGRDTGDRDTDDYEARDPDDVRPVDADAHERVDAAVEKVRNALDGSTIPDDAPGSDLVNEARDLRTEIDEQVDDASERGAGTSAGDGERGNGDAERGVVGNGDAENARTTGDAADGSEDGTGDSGGVEIPVETGTADDGAALDDSPTEADGDGSEASPLTDLSNTAPDVDVDAELDTIRDEVREREANVPPWADDGEDSGDQGSDDEGSDGGEEADDDGTDSGAADDTDDSAEEWSFDGGDADASDQDGPADDGDDRDDDSRQNDAGADGSSHDVSGGSVLDLDADGGAEDAGDGDGGASGAGGDSESGE